MIPISNLIDSVMILDSIAENVIGTIKQLLTEKIRISSQLKNKNEKYNILLSIKNPSFYAKSFIFEKSE